MFIVQQNMAEKRAIRTGTTEDANIFAQVIFTNFQRRTFLQIFQVADTIVTAATVSNRIRTTLTIVSTSTSARATTLVPKSASTPKAPICADVWMTTRTT
jgi:hypothetical protein